MLRTALIAALAVAALARMSSAAEQPRVLILGDSISIGYTPHVQKLLAGEATVVRPMAKTQAENCAGTTKGVKDIDRWLAQDGGKWDVIHFNFGLHDIKRVNAKTGMNSNNPADPRQAEPEQYEKQLAEIIGKLEKTGAKLILCTTTPVPPGGVKPHRDVEDAERYNKIAKELAKKHDIAVNDLYAAVLPKLKAYQLPVNVHFNEQGSKFLAEQVAAAIRAALQDAKDKDKPAPKGSATARRRPNVVFILTDDQRWDALGCAGHPHLKTPHIDRLASEGLHFRNAFCTTSLCSPSRASILSGLYAHAHGVTSNFTEYPVELDSFPRQLQQAGYDTAYLGKWHMGEENDGKRPGFDYFVTHKGQGKYFDTEFNFDGERREMVKGYYTTRVTDLALDWLEGRGEKPFLLMLGHKAPHSFYIPEPKYEHIFDDVQVAYPPSAFHLGDKPAWFKTRLTTWHGIYGPLFDFRKKFPDSSPEAVKDFAAMTRAYWGTLRSVDDSVGRLYAALEKSGQLDNTLFIFAGDNGLLNGEHGMVDKRTMHEPSIRVPLVVRYPGLGKPGRKIDRMVLHEDMAPSILDICGAKPLENIHGKSWRSMASAEQPNTVPWRSSWLYVYNYEKQFPYTPNVRGVRTERWKLIRYPHGDGQPDRHMAELYDLANDPEESKNLIADPKRAGTVKELTAELERLKVAVGLQPDRMPLDEGIKSALPEQSIR